jgi:hypothetical protein
MKGISWRRMQGLTDSLLIKMLNERGLDNVPQWTKKDDVRMAANARWMALGEDRDGPENPDRRAIDDPASVTAEIGAKARELGADLVGSCELTPIMITVDFDMPHRNVISLVVKEDYANVLCQRRSKTRPVGRSKTRPLSVMRYAVLRVVPVVHRRDPRCFA